MSTISKMGKCGFIVAWWLLSVTVDAQTGLRNEVETLIRSGKQSEALKVLNATGDDQNPEHLILWGQAYLQMGRTDLAEEYMKAALDEARSHADQYWIVVGGQRRLRARQSGGGGSRPGDIKTVRHPHAAGVDVSPVRRLFLFRRLQVSPGAFSRGIGRPVNALP